MDRREFNTRLFTGALALPIVGVSATGCATTGGDDEKISGIDTHAHAFHRRLPLVPDRRYTPDYDAPFEAYLAVLDANGMSHGTVIPISILGTNNSYSLEAIRASGGRLRGLAVLDPETDVETIEPLAAEGLVGVRCNLIGKPVPDFKVAPWRGLIDACRAANWQVEIYDDATRLHESLAPLVDLGVNVVVDHFGKPSVELGTEDPGFQYLLGLGRTGQVWVKLSAPYRSSNAIAEAAAPLLLGAYGPQRLMWGSDWPHTGFEGKVHYPELLEQLDTWVPDAQARRTILVDTPAMLFGFS